MRCKADSRCAMALYSAEHVQPKAHNAFSTASCNGAGAGACWAWIDRIICEMNVEQYYNIPVG